MKTPSLFFVKSSEPCFTVRLEIINQFQLFKTPAPSPMADRERRALIQTRDDNYRTFRFYNLLDFSFYSVFKTHQKSKKSNFPSNQRKRNVAITNKQPNKGAR